MSNKSKSKKGSKHLERNFFSKNGTRKKIKSGGTSHLQKSYPGAFPSLGPRIGGFNYLSPMIGKGKHSKKCKCTTCHKHSKSCKVSNRRSHSKKCKCIKCHTHSKSCIKCKRVQQGGQNMPYPNGLLGNAWTPNVSTWRQNNISMDNNHLTLNKYTPDVSREMLDVGANPPFTYLKGGKGCNKKSVTLKKNKKGGSNFLSQDLINLGRQASFGVNSVYNGLRGYSAPVNPLPWKDQFNN